MNIRRIKIEGLHGYLNKDIRFNRNIVLLVGINGSGKTSILNLINWMLTPRLEYLSTTIFKSVSIYFEHQGRKYHLKCEQADKLLSLWFVGIREEGFNKITVNLLARPTEFEEREADVDALIQQYRHLGPDDTEIQTWNLISELPDPKIIGIDRVLDKPSSESNIAPSRLRVQHPRTKRNIAPVATDRKSVV